MSDANGGPGGEALDELHTDFTKTRAYGDFLHLETILNAQHRFKGAHDELLFVIVHQTAELWFKLVLHEARAAIEALRRDRLRPALKMLTRVVRVFEHLAHSWSVLATLTPMEFLAFRDALGQSSGFQSYQYRMVEFLLGDKRAAMVAPHQHDTTVAAELRRTLDSPGLYDEVLRLLARAGLAIDASVLERDWSKPYTRHPTVHAAWEGIYRDGDVHWELYELGEKLADLEEAFPALAVSAPAHRAAHHRPQARDRRLGRRQLPDDGARARILPRTAGDPIDSLDRADGLILTRGYPKGSVNQPTESTSCVAHPVPWTQVCLTRRA